VQYLKYLVHASHLSLLASYKVILCNNLSLQEYIWTYCPINASLECQFDHCINHLIQDCTKKRKFSVTSWQTQFSTDNEKWHIEMGILAQFGPC